MHADLPLSSATDEDFELQHSVAAAFPSNRPSISSPTLGHDPWTAFENTNRASG